MSDIPPPPPTNSGTPSSSDGIFTLAWREVTSLLSVISDFGFKTFVTPRIVRTLYVLTLVAAGLAALGWMFSGFSVNFVVGLFSLVTGPLAFFLYALTARVSLEVVLAIIRIAENTDRGGK
jgi:hypothetical protein